MNEIQRDVRQLVESESQPTVDDVRRLRRRAAADPDMDELAEKLMELEQDLETDGTVESNRLRSLAESVRIRRRLRLSMAEREPFPDLRRELLRRCLDREGGRVVESTDGEVVVEVPDDITETKVTALYHWSRVED